MSYYILQKDHSVVPTDDIFEVANGLRDSEARRVAQSEVNGYWVSTVFLMIDHQFGKGPPLLFETMIFKKGGSLDLYCERCSTWDEAVQMHSRVVDKVLTDGRRPIFLSN